MKTGFLLALCISLLDSPVHANDELFFVNVKAVLETARDEIKKRSPDVNFVESDSSMITIACASIAEIPDAPSCVAHLNIDIARSVAEDSRTDSTHCHTDIGTAQAYVQVRANGEAKVRMDDFQSGNGMLNCIENNDKSNE